jgi:hypothetical protein
MAPTADRQLHWGMATAALALSVILLLAFVPDPFFRDRSLVTRFDDVDSVEPGVAVYFRGAEIGSVRSVELDPATRLFDVDLAVRRDWRPSACSFARITGSNPLVPPRVELVALEIGANACPVARAAARCDALAPRAGTPAIDGCRRGPDLFAAATAAVGEAAAMARTANQMATQLAGLMASGGSGGGTLAIARDSMATVAALRGISERLDASFVPGHGDVALTLANVRRASGRAGSFDVASLNATMREVQTMVAQNQANVAGLLAEGRTTTAETRTLLETMSTSLATTGANLARASDSMGALTERLAADPTYALHGSKFVDPPAPGSEP